MATIKFVQKNKPLSNGEFIIYLRVTKGTDSKYISMKISCKKEHWNAEKQELYKSPNFQQINHNLRELKTKGDKILSDAFIKGVDLSIDEFTSEFLNFKKQGTRNVGDYWDERIEEMKKAGQVGNLKVYKEVKNSFFKFLNNKPIQFSEITTSLVEKYEIHLRSRGNMDSSISTRMRTLRALYNSAVKRDIITDEKYPFEKYSISKLKTKSNKRAISIQQMDSIRNLDTTKYPHLIDSKNYFLFSYFTAGMNFVDMIFLTWDSIQDGKIIYTRRKTKSLFKIKILPPVQEIIDYYKKLQITKYIFPIINKETLNSTQIENRKDKILKKLNKDLKEISKLCNIDTKITSYVARHTFATNLKQKGVATEIISETLGHQNPNTTQVYLKEVEDSIIGDAMDLLL